MNIGKEFEKYAVQHRGISSATLHNYGNQFTNLTPYIIEERPLNVASMDVFSRLMMDRIIFLGEGINDYVANIVEKFARFATNWMKCLPTTPVKTWKPLPATVIVIFG